MIAKPHVTSDSGQLFEASSSLDINEGHNSVAVRQNTPYPGCSESAWAEVPEGPRAEAPAVCSTASPAAAPVLRVSVPTRRAPWGDTATFSELRKRYSQQEIQRLNWSDIKPSKPRTHLSAEV